MMGTRIWALAALLALASAARSGDSGAAYMNPGDVVRGTLSGSADRRMVAFAGVAGSKLSARVAAAKGSALVPRLGLIAPDGVVVDVGDTNPSSRGTAAFKGLPLAATGVWRFVLSADSAVGGTFDLSARAKVPLAARWKGTIEAADVPVDHGIGAAPGGSMSVSVVTQGKTPPAPVVQLIAPSGAIVATVTGTKGRARIDAAPLDEVGTYVVRVRGEPGSFSASAKIRAAAKRSLDFRDVASRPDIQSITPLSAPDDTRVTFSAKGVGFGPQQIAGLFQGATVVRTVPLASGANTSGVAVIDLAGVAPGTYTFRVTTADGGCSDAPLPLTVTNRAPVVYSVDPPAPWGRYPFEAEIFGAGIDAGASFRVLESATGEEVPLEVLDQSEPDRTKLRLSPVVRTTGPCDVEVTDPDGRSSVAAGVLDLLGFKIDPVTLRQVQSAGLNVIEPYAAAVDESRGRVLLAIRDSQTHASFLLCDAATLDVVDTLGIDAAYIDLIDVAWDPVGHTFALALEGKSVRHDAYVRIVRDTDLDHGLSENTVAAANSSGVAVAAARDTGGYMAVWRESAALVDEVRATTFDKDGVPSPPPAHVVAASDFIFEPDVAWTGPDRFVVAYPAPADAQYSGGVWASLVDGAGNALGTPRLVASSTAWYYTAFVQLAQAPANGPTLVNFSYAVIQETGATQAYPACVRLAPVTLFPGPTILLDGPVGSPGGYSFNAVWDPARSEFVAASALEDGGVLIRRIAADGNPLSGAVPEHFYGYWPVLYAGSAPGSLGMASWQFEDVDPDPSLVSYLIDVGAGPYR